MSRKYDLETTLNVYRPGPDGDEIDVEVTVFGSIDLGDPSVGYAGGVIFEEATVDGQPFVLTDAERKQAEEWLNQAAVDEAEDAESARGDQLYDEWKDRQFEERDDDWDDGD